LIAGLPEAIKQINLPENVEEIVLATEDELKKATFFKTPPPIIGVFYRPTANIVDFNLKENLVLALDGIQDPGNLGTIVRLADWFGIEHISVRTIVPNIISQKRCSRRWGLGSVKSACKFIRFLSEKTGIQIYGTFLEGKNIYRTPLAGHGVIVMGNEGNGIRPDVQSLISEKLYIPNYPPHRPTSESLNVAVATAIVCSEFRRR
jgi:TrmH family RNA methyltransferase